MQAHFTALYFTIALVVFCILLTAFWFDRSTPKTDKVSWVLVFLGAAFWFVVLPLSGIEISRKFLKIKPHIPNRGKSNSHAS